MPSPKSTPRLRDIATRTLAHYERNADAFWDGTRDHDVSQNYAALLDAFGDRKGLRILDFGCGPGRDLCAFHEMGHKPVGLDGCAAFVQRARAYTSCEVIHQDFFELALGDRQFDGVFANASLFHVARELLSEVLAELTRVLVPGGVLFCSNPRAFHSYQEGWNAERHGCYWTIEGWTEQIARTGLVFERQYLRPAGKPAEEQPWIAMVWRKVG